MHTNKTAYSFVLDDSVVQIGRDNTCSILLNGFGISRFHASLKLHKDSPEIIVNPNASPVTVNNKQLHQALLCNEDMLTIGIHSFKIAIDYQQHTITLVNESSPVKHGVTGSTEMSIMLIGRDEACDMHLAHPLVSRNHASVFFEHGSYKIVDNGSTNGTYVNGKRVREMVLHEQDMVQVGPFRFGLADGQFTQIDTKSKLHIETCGVSVRAGSKLLLDSISMTIHPGEFVAIIGPSGAGKSTLTKVLCGMCSPDTGTVLVNDLPLNEYSKAFFSNTGYVAQHSMLYNLLTVYETLYEQSIIRLPDDYTHEEREIRIREITDLFGLDQILQTKVGNLSGGEVKRLHIAIELLSSPSVLFLDEPLAGLDPSLIRRFMILFRRICDRGHTLILTTHTLEQIDTCDRLFFVNHGKIAFSGTLSKICEDYAVKTVADIYDLNIQKLPDIRDAGNVEKRFKTDKKTITKRNTRNFLIQIPVMLRRYWRLQMRDYKSLMISCLQIPLIAALLRLLFDDTSFLPVSFYFCIAIMSIWIGGVIAIREIPKEWPYIKRDSVIGLSFVSFTFAKLILAAGSACLAGILLCVSLKLLFWSGMSLSLQTIAFAGVVSGSILGLAAGACVKRSSDAISLLPVIFIPQIFFSGIMIPFDRMNRFGNVLSDLTIAKPLFGMLKKVALLKFSILALSEWLPLFCLLCGLIILMVIGIRFRWKRL
jgi:ABC-type multidrug transport system ATPase subunit